MSMSMSQRMDSFIEELKESVKILNPQNSLRFYVQKIEIESIECDDNKGAFEKIKDQDIYGFGKIEWMKM